MCIIYAYILYIYISLFFADDGGMPLSNFQVRALGGFALQAHRGAQGTASLNSETHGWLSKLWSFFGSLIYSTAPII